MHLPKGVILFHERHFSKHVVLFNEQIHLRLQVTRARKEGKPLVAFILACSNIAGQKIHGEDIAGLQQIQEKTQNRPGET
jgi:hypothetical protein